MMNYLCGCPSLARPLLDMILRFSMNCFRCFPFFAAGSSPTSAGISSTPENFRKYIDGFHGFDSPSQPHKADIIFFHDVYWKGPQESAVQSWMSNTEPSVCWPKAWLSAKYNARILFAQYDAGVQKTATEGLMRLFLIAENLRQDLCSIYKVDCPIFLVGHGLGGLVIKELIRSMDAKLHQERTISSFRGSTESNDLRRLCSFFKNLKGVFYFNTPALGSKLADSTNYSTDRGALLKSAKQFSSKISVLNEWFRTWRGCQTSCKTTAIWAACPTKVPLWYGDWCNHVVEEGAARFDVDNFYTTAAEDHFTVCKLSGESDGRMQRLNELIDPHIEEIAKWHVAHNDESAWVTFVNNFLRDLEVQKLRNREGLHIRRHEIENIRKFPKLWKKLEDGLRDAGLVKTDEDADLESWQPA